jgi:hypothetical protein
MADLPEHTKSLRGESMAVVQVERSQYSYRAAVVAAGGHWHAQHHRLLARIAELDRSGEWAADGARSCAHWLTDALGVDLGTAREWVRIGRSLAALPDVDAAFAEGRLSYSKVRAITRVATVDAQAELIALAQPLSAGQLTHALASWQLRRETPAETDARQRSRTTLRYHDDVHGMGVAILRLPPAVMATVTSAIEARVRARRPDASADASGRWPSLAHQRADAFVELWHEGGASEPATELVLHVRGDGNTMDDGTPISDTVIARFAPRSFVRALIHDANGRPINASGRHRHPTSRQRRVVHERDRRCVDCGATDLLEYDHDPPYEQSRRTVVEELHLRCANCHHRRHRDDP